MAAVFGTAFHAAWERPWLGATASFAAAAVLTAAAFCLAKNRRLSLAAAAAAVVMAAFGRYDSALMGVPVPEGLPDRAAEFVGTVVEEPRLKSAETSLTVGEITALPEGRRLPGKAMLHLPTWSDFSYGEGVAWRCKPRATDAASAGSGKTLLIDRVAWQCWPDGQPRVESSSRGSRVMSAVYRFKGRVRRTVGDILPEPESSFLMGLILGDRDGIPDGMKQEFRDTGTSHILAVSGYNTAKVADAVFLALAVAAVRRRRAAVVVVMSLAVFTAVAGGEASVVRAVIMGSAGALSLIFGRRGNGAGALVLAAALMLFANPLVLKHDLGFQLSFAALLGLRWLAPPIERNLKFLPEFLGVRRNLAETLSATAATAPICLAAFGSLPLVSPLANLLILPAIPWAMGIGALAALVGSIFEPAGAAAAWPAWLILRYVESVIVVLADVMPWRVALDAGFAGEAALFALIGAVRFGPGLLTRLRRRLRAASKIIAAEYDF
jgi:competence protein ComEC